MEIEIKEEVQIGDIILEAGDKIQVLSESKWFAMTPFSDGSQAFFYQVDTDNIYSITVVNGKAKKATKVGKNALKTAYPTPEETEETDVPVMAVKKMKVRLGENVLSESIPAENIKRGRIRDDGKYTSVESGAFSNYGLDSNDIVGWFANKYNMAEGWSIYKASDSDKKEFGQHVFRTYSGHTESTSIIQFNIVAGTYAFLDNDDYLEGNIRFQKMTGYDRLLIDNTPVALEEFDIAFR